MPNIVGIFRPAGISNELVDTARQRLAAQVLLVKRDNCRADAPAEVPLINSNEMPRTVNDFDDSPSGDGNRRFSGYRGDAPDSHNCLLEAGYRRLPASRGWTPN